MHYAQLLLRHHCIYLRIICTVHKCFFGLTVYIFILYALCSTASSTSLYISSYYMYCVQILLRPHCLYLNIICTALNCFFDITVYIFVLNALCTNVSSTLLYISSYYVHCTPLLLRPQRLRYRKTFCHLHTP